MITTDTHVYFWNGLYSNWDNCHFEDFLTGERFKNSEQAFMWYKADTFGDRDIRTAIQRTSNPKEVKELGRQVKNFNEEVWNNVRFDKMVYVNELKFTQNPYYGQTLKNTGNRILVEASPYDKIWGVGLLETDPLILDEKNWTGLNLLGKALMEVREKHFK
jgi:hypothetical protein